MLIMMKCGYFLMRSTKLLGNRPKMYPGHIGGHCVIPNLDLINNQTLNIIKKMNNIYAKKVKNVKSINKKYSKKS